MVSILNIGVTMAYNLQSLRILALGDPRVFAETIYRQFGLKVIGLRNNDPLESRVQKESISAMASVITEDADELMEISSPRLAVKKLAESCGYIVRVLEEMGTGGVAAGPMAPIAPTPTKPGTRPKPGKAPSRRKEKRRDPFNPPRPAKMPKPKAREEISLFPP